MPVVDRLEALIRPRAEALQRVLGSPVRTTRIVVILGRLLGLAFLVCFVTGVYSHLLQSPVAWLATFPQPAYLYAWTQGAHVVVGSMLLPILLAKLWTVYPRLFQWPPVTGPVTFLERVSVGVLVATALVEPVIGILNAVQWYPWSFSFRATHYALAWVMIGAMTLHIAVQLPVIREHWRRKKGEERDA